MSAPNDVMNLALGFLGQSPITDMNNPTSQLAVTCTRLYPAARNAVLCLTDWSFATGWVRLTLSPDVPRGEWRKQYNFPPQVPTALMIWELEDADAQWAKGFDPIGNVDVVYTDAPGLIASGETVAHVNARCTFERIDTTKWNPIAVNALAYKLAADIAMTVTGQAAKAQLMLQAMQYWIGQATGKDGKQRFRQVPLQGNLATIRGG